MTPQKTILVAEDEADVREPLAAILEIEGFTVLEASNGEEAIEKAREAQPDLCLLDMMMPKKDGIEVLTYVRGEAWGATTPVIILTALSDMDSVSAAIAAGGVNTEYLVKTDWKLEAVVKKVKEKLGEK